MGEKLQRSHFQRFCTTEIFTNNGYFQLIFQLLQKLGNQLIYGNIQLSNRFYIRKVGSFCKYDFLFQSKLTNPKLISIRIVYQEIANAASAKISYFPFQFFW